MCGRRKCNLGILEWILKSIRGSNNLTLVGSPWLELDLILLLETRVYNAMSVLVRLIWSNLCWKWVGLGWAVHFLVHVGSQRTVPNSPLGHSHSIALNWSLCIMLHFMRWSSCAGPHHIEEVHIEPVKKKTSLCQIIHNFYLYQIVGLCATPKSLPWATETIWQQCTW